MLKNVRLSKLFFLLLFTNTLTSQNDKPNILLVIADDMGVDALNGYHSEGTFPTTPTFDSLRSKGITFENVFSAPKCTPSRVMYRNSIFCISSTLSVEKSS